MRAHLCRLDDDIRDAVSCLRGCGWVPLLHLLGELHMAHCVVILVCILAQALQNRRQHTQAVQKGVAAN